MSKWTQKYYQKLKATLCGRKLDAAGCSYTVFQVHGMYTHVCGKLIGYQNRSTDAFQQTEHRTNGIDGNYVDGVSITHGYHPRKHILLLLFLMAVHYLCSCTNNPISPSLLQPVPSFVGNDYFCDTGSTTTSVTIPCGMVRNVGLIVPVALSTLLHGSLKLSPPR